MKTLSLNISKTILILTFLGCLYVNYISNAWPLNGFTAGELSDLYPNQFTPSGFTFAVWGLIYLSAIIAIIILLLANQNQISIEWYSLFSLINVLNLSWLLAWHYQFMVLSVIVMLALLVTLIIFYIQIRNHPSESLPRKILTILTSFYLSWISVALAANITALLVKFQFMVGNVRIESSIAAIVLTVAFSVCLWLTTKYKDFLHPLVLAWASYGIFVKTKSLDILENNIIVVASGIIVVASIFISIRNLRRAVLSY
jgi:hypothetical protein